MLGIHCSSDLCISSSNDQPWELPSLQNSGCLGPDAHGRVWIRERGEEEEAGP
ncbi:hypothetical protein [Oryza sativa Japonica Group]|uniref:Uncharacterized protein n=1 Tax=Oryza sativa subsp. japonica TaxID=39947 RepID=Q5N9E4_ORYSJ|nr:hypothetical protein [Oryza sativa Japonica Group]